MEGVLLEEEQISLLGKMLYYSADHLTTREREAYDHLVESLLRKVNQLRAMEKRGSRPGPIATASVNEAKYQAKRNALMHLRPEDVVKVFVDAWNKQDFETEFFCLARHFPSNKRKADTVEEYLRSRISEVDEKQNETRHKQDRWNRVQNSTVFPIDQIRTSIRVGNRAEQTAFDLSSHHIGSGDVCRGGHGCHHRIKPET